MFVQLTSAWQANEGSTNFVTTDSGRNRIGIHNMGENIGLPIVLTESVENLFSSAYTHEPIVNDIHFHDLLPFGQSYMHPSAELIPPLGVARGSLSNFLLSEYGLGHSAYVLPQ
jgi:hypothetical protein